MNPPDIIKCRAGMLQWQQSSSSPAEGWQYTYRHRVCLGGSSSQLCSDLSNLIMLLHASMYQGQAPACTFHTNNLPLGIWPGCLPQSPCCKLGHLSTEVPIRLSSHCYLKLVKATWYRTKISSLFWSAGERCFIAYTFIFQPLLWPWLEKNGSYSLTQHQCSRLLLCHQEMVLNSFAQAEDLLLHL